MEHKAGNGYGNHQLTAVERNVLQEVAHTGSQFVPSQNELSEERPSQDGEYRKRDAANADRGRPNCDRCRKTSVGDHLDLEDFCKEIESA